MQGVSAQPSHPIPPSRDFCCNLSPRVYHRLLKSESDRDDRTLIEYQRFHVKRVREKTTFSPDKAEELDIFGERKHHFTSNPHSYHPPRNSFSPDSAVSVPSIRLETSCGSTISCSLSDASDSELSNDASDDTAFFSGFSQDLTEALSKSVEEAVVLPNRYRVRAFQGSSGENSINVNGDNEQDDSRSREKDLSTALKWIRQEILEMKAQDKSLLKQFIELRASILQLRCLYDIHGSCSDVSSLDGSTFSLNEQAKSPRMRRLVVENDAIKPSLSLPSSPRVARFKWKSDEFI